MHKISCIVYFHLYEISKIGKATEEEYRLVNATAGSKGE